jgi:hypothetical protein
MFGKVLWVFKSLICQTMLGRITTLIEDLLKSMKTIIVWNKYFGKVLKTAGKYFWLHHRISLS